MAESMKAWQQAAPGRIDENLKLIDNAPLPNAALKKGEILVRVISARLNPSDYKDLEMGLKSYATVKFHKVAGMDLSGVVVGVAHRSTDAQVGDNISGRIEPFQSHESLSKYVVLPREGYAVLPNSVDLDHAAGMPTAGMTAYQSIKPYIKAGDRIFINDDSGGTGTFGIQIAKALGCHITKSCSTAKVDLVKKLGADAVIDYRVDDIVAVLRAEGQVYDLVPEGHYIGVGGSASLHTARNIAEGLRRPTFLGGTPRNFVPYFTKNVHEDYKQLAKWLGDGTITTIIESTFEFERAIEAFQYLKTGSSSAKIIVHVSASA